MILKIIGLGIKGYFKDGFNLFDAFIILLSTIDLVVNLILLNSKSNSSLNILRGLRILRVLKIAKSDKNMKEL